MNTSKKVLSLLAVIGLSLLCFSCSNLLSQKTGNISLDISPIQSLIKTFSKTASSDYTLTITAKGGTYNKTEDITINPSSQNNEASLKNADIPTVKFSDIPIDTAITITASFKTNSSEAYTYSDSGMYIGETTVTLTDAETVEVSINLSTTTMSWPTSESLTTNLPALSNIWCYSSSETSDSYSTIKGLTILSAKKTQSDFSDYIAKFDSSKWTTVLKTDTSVNFSSVDNTDTSTISVYVAYTTEYSGRILVMIEQETILKSKEVVFYVSNGGNDSNDGLTSDKPFLTLQKACDAALVYTYEAYKLDNKTNVLASIKILTSLTAESDKTYTDKSLASITNTHSSEYIPNITITNQNYSLSSDSNSTLDGNNLVRLIKSQDVNLTVYGLKLTNGSASFGGAIYFTSTISTGCSLNIYGSILNKCVAKDSSGGGLFCKNFNFVNLQEVTINSCSAICGGGILCDTSDTTNPGTLTISASTSGSNTISNCTADGGGAIYMSSNNLRLCGNSNYATLLLNDNTSTMGKDIVLNSTGLTATNANLTPHIIFDDCKIECNVKNVESTTILYIVCNSTENTYPNIQLAGPVKGPIEINIQPSDKGSSPAHYTKKSKLINIDAGATYPTGVFTLDTSLSGYSINTKTGFLTKTAT